MKLLEDTPTSTAVDACAGAVMDAALMVIREVRAEIRRSRPGNLSLTQIRALGCVETSPGTSLSHVADELGIARPSASHLVEGMVRRGLLARRPHPEDRRQVRLDLTPRGERALQHAFGVTRADLARRLAPLTPVQRAAVVDTMRLLRPLLGSSESPAGR